MSWGAGRRKERGEMEAGGMRSRAAAPPVFSWLTFPLISSLATIRPKEKSCTGTVFLEKPVKTCGFCGPQSLVKGGAKRVWKQPAGDRRNGCSRGFSGRVPRGLGCGVRGGGQTVFRRHQFWGCGRDLVALLFGVALKRHCPVCPREVGRGRSGLLGRDCFPSYFPGAGRGIEGSRVRRMVFAGLDSRIQWHRDLSGP